MRNKIGNSIWGILFVLIGLAIGLKAFNIIDSSIFFNGWWTLFIIVPSITSMIKEGVKPSNSISLIIGILLLLSATGIYTWDFTSKLILPIIFVGIGISIIFKDFFNKSINTIKSINKDGIVEYNAIFASQEILVPAEEFKGAKINAIFGGVELNLKNAIISKDIVIESNAIFGGVEITVPSNVKVKVSSTPIFGGVNNKANIQNDKSVHTIYISCTCMFGGVEIK
ncbi:MAG: LiaF-related protein [Clostridia bacterium]|nr:LiaF-related protein [Clostridia bacterium]